MTMLLAVRDLTTTFETADGVARAVDGVSFDLAEGETLALVGESGSGKTVTALSILRLIPEPAGRIAPGSRIEFAGRDLLSLSPRELREVRGAEIAMIFQEPMTSLNPVLTVGTQIAETVLAHEAASKREARERALDMLRLVGIADAESRLKSYPHELSGGMRQRVMIAIALVCRPRILIADEPTTALDVTIQAQILDLLTDLKRRLGMAMILITHNLGIAAGIADRVAVMYGGRIVEVAPTVDLYREPAHPYTDGLLRAAPRLDGPDRPTPSIPGSVPPATDWPSGCRFHPRCQYAWERCQSEPPLLEAGPARTARCWLVDEPARRKP
ncbi:MAG: ABC transporter ATP-binding protein [Gemmatimonadetes bacterium]|nr:ABC transporter ATP-binding protein [Gemmatimonadota bacterium]